MGEVFRGRDTRLNRDVAIKILPPLFADDPERLARFEREAQILASLNHPNIAHIYGIEESSGRKALVIELVDGDDLSVRIARDGAMPLAESLAIARQIADALACAHEQNVIHRDLKPANVKVREDGTVKVLDFGLAKLADPSPTVASSPVLSPTITSPATQLGVILGTAAYMAPEQARGKAVDKRADVWAFALVLYEMLTGKRAFEGSEISDTLAFVLTKDPDWSALPGDTPAGIRRLLRRCLHKERNQRLADMSDARLELDEALAPIESDRTSMAPAAPSRSRWAVAAVAAAILAAGALGAGVAWSFLSRPAPAPPVVRFTVPLPDGTEFTNAGRHLLTISPDGSRIVFVANQQLYLRSAGSTTPQPIAGSGTTGPVIGPVFSPDGEHLAYYSSAALRRISVAGGLPVTLALIARNPFGINWTTAGIFVSNGSEGIVRIPADGGQPQTVVEGSQDSILQGPQLLPGGEWLMFTVAGTRTPNRWASARIVAQSLKSGERRVLIEGGTDARYVTTGHLLYALGGVVFGAPFDLEGIKVSGPARPVIEGYNGARSPGPRSSPSPGMARSFTSPVLPTPSRTSVASPCSTGPAR